MVERKPWGGRFSAPTDALVETFTQSISVDRRLYKHDIAGSIAHAHMLSHVGVLTASEYQRIRQGLENIAKDIEAGRFIWREGLEDVHMNIEIALTERIGDVGKKLHTGRSRNDQVATDLRLYVRDAIDEIAAAIRALQETMLDIAEREAAAIMPGHTHLQVAQPVTFGHHIMAWYEMLHRDRRRFIQTRARVNVMPLGAAALAGTSFPIDRDFTARELGFDAPAANSLDAVSDRDFVIEFNANAALLMLHFSRMTEEIILWVSEPFQFVEIGDAFCTGSSIMPQKKNPDIAELIRGKSARVAGNLTTLLFLVKSQPLAYNRDNQEDKMPVFDSADTVLQCVGVFNAMLSSIRINHARMLEAAGRGYATATDLAEYLVKKGVPFRDAHETVGRAVRYCIDQHIDLAALPLSKLKEFSPMIDDDVFDALTLEGSVNSRGHVGGTAPSQVRAAVARARAEMADTE